MGLFDQLKKSVESLASQGGDLIQSAAKTVGELGQKASDFANEKKNQVLSTIDANGSGEIDVEDFIIHGLRTPGIGINRASFLRAEFQKDFPREVIDNAVEHNPAYAGIKIEDIDRHADQVISYERNCVTGISAALGMPGGVAMAATIPTDMIQYYGFMLRAAQKLLYLYGFPEINVDEKNNVFDSETLNMLTLCLGVMFGVAGANQALKAIANALAKGVEQKLLRAALTKGTIYPIVKSVSKWFGVHMTKSVFAGFFKKAIPVVGGVIGGSMTYLSFGPCCNKLKESLQDTILSNPLVTPDPDETLETLDVAGLVSEDTEIQENIPETPENSQDSETDNTSSPQSDINETI